MNNNERKLVLISANLQRSTKMFNKMNPFVKIITKKQEYRSSINKAGEKQPQWNSTEIIEVQEGENIKLLILDFNSRADPELIAETTLTYPELDGFFGKKNVYYQNQVVGQIELQVQKKTYVNQDYLNDQNKVKIINQQKYQGPQFQYP